MEEISFSKNFSDLSVSHGVNAGFQFEFYCERCGDTWRTEFTPYRSGQASGWMSKASGIFGGILGNVGSAVEGLAESGWGKARDEAFSAAIEKAKGHFHRCARCHQYVCDRCWNKDKGLCLNDAPSIETEVETAMSQAEVAGAVETATEEGMKRGKSRNVDKPRQLVCPKCGALNEGARFCPECGQMLNVKLHCPGCNAELTPGTKFCPECGHKIV